MICEQLSLPAPFSLCRSGALQLEAVPNIVSALSMSDGWRLRWIRA